MICNEFWFKVKLIWKKKPFFLRDLSQKKWEGAKMPSPCTIWLSLNISAFSNLMTNQSDGWCVSKSYGGGLATASWQQLQPISFFSRSLSHRAQKLWHFWSRAFATCLAVKQFEHYLHNPHFYSLTDHKPLIYSIKPCNTKHSPC